MVTVDEIMTTNVVTLQMDDSILKGMALMAEKNIRHIPIVDKNHHLVGVVSHRDLLRADISCLEQTESVARSSVENSPIETIMTKNVRTASAKDNLRSVGLALQKGKFGCIPIVEGGLLVGIVTDTDFVSAALTMIEELENYESSDDDTVIDDTVIDDIVTDDLYPEEKVSGFE